MPPKLELHFNNDSSGESVSSLANNLAATLPVPSTYNADGLPAASPATSANAVLNEHWPSLSRALDHCERKTADQFSALAYNAIEGGIIRLEERRHLAREAQAAGIRPFDAQLLIACALRQWVLHHAYDPTPSKDAPRLSFEYKSYYYAWTRTALIIATFLAFEFFILYKWLIQP